MTKLPRRRQLKGKVKVTDILKLGTVRWIYRVDP